MTRDELWDVYMRVNPEFDQGPIHFTAKGIKDFFDQTWDKAHQQGVRSGRALEQGEHSRREQHNPLAGLFR